MKHSLRNVLALALVGTLALTGCTAKAPATAQLKVGILQGEEHPALDASREGFIEALAKNGYTDGKEIVIDYQNGQGDQSNLKTMSQKFVTDKTNLMLTIGTQASVSMAAETKDIPILVTAVTDPQSAGLVVTNEKPDTNVSGTSDMSPIKEQIDLLMKLLPETKSIALLYNSSEDNSILQANTAEEYATSLGLTVGHQTVTSTNDIAQTVEAIAGKFDAIYIPTDNMIAKAMPTVADIATTKKIPVIAGEEGMVKQGALASVSISYYELGYKTGEMAAKIFKGEAKTQDMAIEYAPKPTLIFNAAMFKALGLEMPADLAEGATIVNAE